MEKTYPQTHFPFVGVDPSAWLLERAEAIDRGERVILPPMEATFQKCRGANRGD